MIILWLILFKIKEFRYFRWIYVEDHFCFVNCCWSFALGLFSHSMCYSFHMGKVRFLVFLPNRSSKILSCIWNISYAYIQFYVQWWKNNKHRLCFMVPYIPLSCFRRVGRWGWTCGSKENSLKTHPETYTTRFHRSRYSHCSIFLGKGSKNLRICTLDRPHDCWSSYASIWKICILDIF